MNYKMKTLYKTKPITLNGHPILSRNTWCFTFNGTHFVNTEVPSFTVTPEIATQFDIKELFELEDVQVVPYTSFHESLQRHKDLWLIGEDVRMPNANLTLTNMCVVRKSAVPRSNLVLKRLVQETRYRRKQVEICEAKLRNYMSKHPEGLPKEFHDVFTYVKTLCTEDEWDNYHY